VQNLQPVDFFSAFIKEVALDLGRSVESTKLSQSYGALPGMAAYTTAKQQINYDARQQSAANPPNRFQLSAIRPKPALPQPATQRESAQRPET
jgi:hypothetical protein